MVSARSLIDHEDGLRRQVVVVNPKTSIRRVTPTRRGRAIAQHVLAPPDVYLRYGGAAQAQAAAAHELLLHSAAAFVLIVLLLALGFGYARHVLLVLVALRPR